MKKTLSCCATHFLSRGRLVLSLKRYMFEHLNRDLSKTKTLLKENFKNSSINFDCDVFKAFAQKCIYAWYWDEQLKSHNTDHNQSFRQSSFLSSYLLNEPGVTSNKHEPEAVLVSR